MLSEVGGLLGIMIIFSRGVIAIWNFNSFDNFLVSRLFKIKLPKEEVEEFTHYFNQSEFIKLSNYPNCKDLVRSLLTTRCNRCRCKLSRE